MTNAEKNKYLEIIEKMKEFFPDDDLLIVNTKTYGGFNCVTGKRIRVVQEEIDANADNMFYNLGYEKEESFKVCYYTKQGSYNAIDFYYEEKSISLNGDFNIQELKAINEKVKELGWYD